MRLALALLLMAATLTSAGCASGPEDGWEELAELKAMRGRTRWHRASVRSGQRFHKIQIRAYRGSVEIDRFRIHCHDKPKIRELSVPGTINAGRHTTVVLPKGAVIQRVEFLGQAIDKWANLYVYGRLPETATPPPE